jgi:GntR family transcriptional regulator/MocR family aminotransferase
VRRVKAIASLSLRLERGPDAALQEQLSEGLRRAIVTGALGPGARLPGARALAAELSVSRTTVVAALLRLVDEGYLVSRERSGVFVAREPPPEGRPGAPPDAPRASPLRLSRRAEEQVREATAVESLRPRPLAFRLSRPALDAFPARVWGRLLARRAARVTPGQLDYGQESPELRSAVAELVSVARQTRVEAEQVLIFAGGQRALEFAVSALIDPGDAAWMEEPGYPGARNVLRSAGARVVAVPVDAQGLSVGAGEAAARGARLAYVTPSCQFPLGVTMSLARRRQLLRWAGEADACVVEDDYDAEFRHAGPPLAALHGLDEAGRVVYVNSFSRTMFPAIRLGFLVAPAGLADRLRAARATMEEQLPSLVQLALADFIAEGHYARHVRRMRVLYRARRDALVEAAAASGAPLLRLRPSGSGLHVIADLAPGLDPDAVSGAATRRGVEAAPLSRFYADSETCPAALVLGFGAVRPERARAAMNALAAAAAEVARAPAR